MEEYFTSPDLNNPIDQSVVALTVFFTLFGGLGNVLNIPFFTRDGGLLTYSKFAKGVVLGPTVPSRVGMTLVYAPACYFGVSALGKMSSQTLWTHRTALTSAMMVAHFGKRTLECLFLHSYSGGMPLASSLFISFFYSILSVSNSTCCCCVLDRCLGLGVGTVRSSYLFVFFLYKIQVMMMIIINEMSDVVA